jgi:LacI family transcriptional regulator
MSRATIKDVADAAGVSIATVSRVLNDRGGAITTAQAVRAAADRLGYAPNALARMLITQKSMTIGLLQPTVSDSFAGQVLDGVEDAAYELGYSVIICSIGGGSSRLEHYARLLASRQVDAAVVMSTAVTATQHQLLRALALPYVVVAGSSPAPEVPVVAVDGHQAATDATDALIAAGHVLIGMIAGGADDPVAGVPRIHGFQAACDAAGISPGDRPIEHGDFGFDSGLVAMRRLLDRRPDLTAVFAVSDEMAVAAMTVADERGLRVPDDLSVVGFDAIPLARMTRPPLVSVSQPLREMGYQAVRAAEQLVRGDVVPTLPPMPHTLTGGRTIRTISDT